MLPPVALVGLDHLGEAGRPVMQHVRQQQRERLVADDLAGAPDGVAEAERRLLAGEARLTGARELPRQLLQLLLLAALGKRGVELVGDVEMVLDHALVAPGDEDEVLDPGLARLVDDMLHDRAGRRRSASPSAPPWWRAGSGCRDRRRGGRLCGCASSVALRDTGGAEARDGAAEGCGCLTAEAFEDAFAA